MSNRRTIEKWILAGSLALAPLAGQVAAQTSPPKPVVFAPIEVVATRFPEAPHDVPLSIEVISGDDLRARGATSLRDALALAAGIAIAPGGDAGPASAVPEFWGVREFDAFLLVVDGIPWGGAFNPAVSTLSLHDVERIEVLRGPAPVTYGATSFVGVIHVVHRASAARDRSLSAYGGSFGSGGLTADFAMPSLGAWTSRALVRGAARCELQSRWRICKRESLRPFQRVGEAFDERIGLGNDCVRHAFRTARVPRIPDGYLE